MALHKVRLSIAPDKTVEVGDAEYIDLQRQGLLVDEGAVAKKSAGGGPTGAPIVVSDTAPEGKDK